MCDAATTSAASMVNRVLRTGSTAFCSGSYTAVGKATAACDAVLNSAIKDCELTYLSTGCTLPFAWTDFLCYSVLSAKDVCVSAAHEAAARCLEEPARIKMDCEKPFENFRRNTQSISGAMHTMCGGFLKILFSKTLVIKWGIGFQIKQTTPVDIVVRGGKFGINFYPSSGQKRTLAFLNLATTKIPANGADGSFKGGIEMAMNAGEIFAGTGNLIFDIVKGIPIRFGSDPL